MSSKAMSLKAKIRNLAKDKGIAAQVILQNYMFERFLERVSLSAYKDKFILKGGMLVAALVGLDTRATMDLDATIRAYPLNEELIRSAIEQICAVNIDDDVKFNLIGVSTIRKDDEYGGVRASLESVYDTLTTPLSVDITSGDAITPGAMRYILRGIFDDSKRIELWAYNIETVLAEKVETILRRGTFNTRPRDFYDVYILTKTQKFDRHLFLQALNATIAHRETSVQISNTDEILKRIFGSTDLRSYWTKYRREYTYAADITYEDIMKALEELLSSIKTKTEDA